MILVSSSSSFLHTKTSVKLSLSVCLAREKRERELITLKGSSSLGLDDEENVPLGELEHALAGAAGLAGHVLVLEVGHVLADGAGEAGGVLLEQRVAHADALAAEGLRDRPQEFLQGRKKKRCSCCGLVVGMIFDAGDGFEKTRENMLNA